VSKRKIYYYDTDCGGVVYHANYLNFFEEARTEELEKLGLTINELTELNCYFVVNHEEIFYKFPAKYADTLDISAKIVELTPVRMVFEYLITNQEGRVTTEGETSLVCVTKEGKIGSWPKELCDKIKIMPRTNKSAANARAAYRRER
jgi:acyl-CoA thioester hydrolase